MFLGAGCALQERSSRDRGCSTLTFNKLKVLCKLIVLNIISSEARVTPLCDKELLYKEARAVEERET